MSLLSDNLDEIERELRALADQFHLGWVSYREVGEDIESLARRVAVESERAKAL